MTKPYLNDDSINHKSMSQGLELFAKLVRAGFSPSMHYIGNGWTRGGHHAVEVYVHQRRGPTSRAHDFSVIAEDLGWQVYKKNMYWNEEVVQVTAR